MKIAKTHQESGLGIYAKSKKVESKQDWEEAKNVSHEMIAWMGETNGKFKGTHTQAYAMAHCQVAPIEDPWQLFVVDKALVEPEKIEKGSKQDLSNTYFEAQAIYNAEILETPQKVEKDVPQRKVTHDEKDKGRIHVEMVTEKKTISNVISVPEACMSFPHRKARNTDRFYEIKVRYQYLTKKGKVKTFEGWVNGLKAHILQHEIQHFNGKNIFYLK